MEIAGELDRLFDLRPKLSPDQARAIMKAAIDPADGGLKMPRGSSWQRPTLWHGPVLVCGESPCGCNGLLLQSTNHQFGRATGERKRKRETGSKRKITVPPEVEYYSYRWVRHRQLLGGKGLREIQRKQSVKYWILDSKIFSHHQQAALRKLLTMALKLTKGAPTQCYYRWYLH
jgi:hypothetical protein